MPNARSRITTSANSRSSRSKKAPTLLSSLRAHPRSGRRTVCPFPVKDRCRFCFAPKGTTKSRIPDSGYSSPRCRSFDRQWVSIPDGSLAIRNCGSDTSPQVGLNPPIRLGCIVSFTSVGPSRLHIDLHNFRCTIAPDRSARSPLTKFFRLSSSSVQAFTGGPA
jgi:hypothetical protein